MTIYHSADSRIGYIEEVTFGALPASPTMQGIKGASALTKGIEADIIRVDILNQRTPYKLLKGAHNPVLSVEFALQNITLPNLIEDITKSYSFVILDDTGSSIYRVFEGCRMESLTVSGRVNELVRTNLILTPRSYREETSISGLTWGSAWTETPFAWYDARIELLKEITGESPSGSGTGPYTCANSPFADRDEDGSIDDTDDITVYDNAVPETPASVDSSAGTFMLTEAPAGAVTCDYIYEDQLLDIMSIDLVFANNFARVRNISLDGAKARQIREGALEVTGEFSFFMENSDVVDAILADTAYWGIQLKLGPGENGTHRIRLKDKFKFNVGDVPSNVNEIISARAPFESNDFNIF